MRNNKGITLIALAITAFITIIIASVATYSGINALNESISKANESELKLVQHAVMENYTKYLTIKNLTSSEQAKYIIGTQITFADAKAIADKIGVTLKVNDYDSLGTVDETNVYYELSEENLYDLGIQDTIDGQLGGEPSPTIIDTYIVNYATGEVMNKTKILDSGVSLYVYSVDLR